MNKNFKNGFEKIALSDMPRKGKPRTDAERIQRHKKLHGTKKLPPRGTGLMLKTKVLKQDKKK